MRRDRLADGVGDDDRSRLALRVRAPPPLNDAELEQEELFEDQPAVRRRAERVQLIKGRVAGRKMHFLQCLPPIHQPLALANIRRERIRQPGGSCCNA